MGPGQNPQCTRAHFVWRGCGLLTNSTTHNNESKKTQHDNNIKRTNSQVCPTCFRLWNWEKDMSRNTAERCRLYFVTVFSLFGMFARSTNGLQVGIAMSVRQSSLDFALLWHNAALLRVSTRVLPLFCSSRDSSSFGHSLVSCRCALHHTSKHNWAGRSATQQGRTHENADQRKRNRDRGRPEDATVTGVLVCGRITCDGCSWESRRAGCADAVVSE